MALGTRVPLPNILPILTRTLAGGPKEPSLRISLIRCDERDKEEDLKIPSWSRTRLIPLGFGLLALLLIVGLFALGARHSAAQTADTDGDSYADDLEEQLGSSPTDPDNTPEHFALLWTCTDGNDNDKDGKRDFVDPGCRNTVPGSSPTPAPTQAPTQPPAGTGGGSSSGGLGGGGSSGSGGGSPTGGGSGADDNAVLGGSGVPIGGGTSDGGGSGSGAASDTRAGDGSGTDTESAAADSTSADAAGATGAGDQNAASQEGSDDSGFPWMISLLILLGGLAAGAICWALLGRKARSRQSGASGRF